jgi:hypothetical protein
MSVEQQFRAGKFVQGVFLDGGAYIGLGTRCNSIYNSHNAHYEEYTKYLLYHTLNFSCQRMAELDSSISSYYSWGENQLLQLTDSLVIAHIKPKQVQMLQTYLPPKCISVNTVAKNIHSKQEEYWFLTDRSEVYKYQIGEHGKDFVNQASKAGLNEDLKRVLNDNSKEDLN